MFEDKHILILALLAKHEEWAYGLDLVAASDKRLGRGTIYMHLSELEEKRQVEARLEPLDVAREREARVRESSALAQPPRVVGPRLPRRQYRITDEGRKRLLAARPVLKIARTATASMLAEMLHKHQQEQLMQSWCLQPREERKSRLLAVMELSQALLEIRQVDCFSTALGEDVIESVIQGDWERALADARMHFRFEGESEGVRLRYAPLWANFLALVEAHVTNLGAPRA